MWDDPTFRQRTCDGNGHTDWNTMPADHKLFILDDDEDFRADLGEFLTNEGWDVVSAGDARSISADELAGFDVLILDLSMPGRDGATVLRELADLSPKPEVIVVSGYGEDVINAVADAGRLSHVRIKGTLQKPFDPDALLRLLASAPTTAAKSANAPQHTDSEVTSALRMALAAASAAAPFPMTFQPQVRSDDLSFAGAEALLGNELPNLGAISPERIVAAAAGDAKLAEALAHETFRAAVIGCKAWRDKGYRGSVSVNVPIDALRGAGAAARFADIARSAGLTPDSVICELTEDAVYASSSDSLIAIAQLRLEGFGVALDDIGQRNSGLLQVSKLPLTELKIDRELIVEARASDKARSIIASLAGLGRALSMKVVAEGIETTDDLAFVRTNQIDCVQGYLVSRKLPLPALMGWLETRKMQAAH